MVEIATTNIYISSLKEDKQLDWNLTPNSKLTEENLNGPAWSGATLGPFNLPRQVRSCYRNMASTGILDIRTERGWLPKNKEGWADFFLQVSEHILLSGFSFFLYFHSIIDYLSFACVYILSLQLGYSGVCMCIPQSDMLKPNLQGNALRRWGSLECD